MGFVGLFVEPVSCHPPAHTFVPRRFLHPPTLQGDSGLQLMQLLADWTWQLGVQHSQCSCLSESMKEFVLVYAHVLAAGLGPKLRGHLWCSIGPDR